MLNQAMNQMNGNIDNNEQFIYKLDMIIKRILNDKKQNIEIMNRLIIEDLNRIVNEWKERVMNGLIR